MLCSSASQQQCLKEQHQNEQCMSFSLRRGLRGSCGRNVLSPQPPQEEGPGLQNAWRDCAVNRCFEALERADISQAPDTATQPPRRIAHSPAEAGC